MSDAREYEYDSPQVALTAMEALLREDHAVWLHPEHRTAPVDHVVWIVTVKP